MPSSLKFNVLCLLETYIKMYAPLHMAGHSKRFTLLSEINIIYGRGRSFSIMQST